MADDDQSSIIPSVVDGLNPVQRTILICALKNPNFQEVKEFIGYVSEHSAYRYQKQNLKTTMTGMAQNYPGSNNINLLHPYGEDSRYMCTALSSITRHLFHESDEPLLKYFNEDIVSDEPTRFMPIIPMVLVNGSEGIRTKYNPYDIIANIRRLLRGKEPVPMVPWFKWFRGTIKRTTATSYTTFGLVEERLHAPNRLFITDLPIGKCAEEYEEFLKAAVLSGEDKEPFIKKYIAHHCYDGTVTFEVVMSRDQMNKTQKEVLLDKFKLATNFNTNSMLLLDANGERKMYDNPEEILKEFYDLRLEYYKKRKSALLDLVGKALLQLENYVPLYGEFCEETIILNDKEDEVLYAELKNNYRLPSMNASMCSVWYKEQQRAEWFAILRGLDDTLSCTSVKNLWLQDLGALEAQLKKQEKEDDEAERRTEWIPVSDFEIEEEKPSEVSDSEIEEEEQDVVSLVQDEVETRKKRVREQDKDEDEDEAESTKRRRTT